MKKAKGKTPLLSHKGVFGFDCQLQSDITYEFIISKLRMVVNKNLAHRELSDLVKDII